MAKIFACEKEYLLNYQQKILNATTEEITAAQDIFGNSDLPDILSIDGNIARIKIEGILTRKGPSPIARFFGFGGTGYNDIIESLQSVEDRPDIEKIILEMNTPGGDVKGVDGVYIAVKDANKKIKVIAENHGLIASGGYWIAAAASKIVAIGPSVETGSIGVIITAIDDTQYLKDMGVKIVKIVSRNAPKKDPDLSKKAGRDVIQDRADAIERVFIKRISEGRKVSEDHIIKKFGRGSVLIADDPDKSKDDALSVGMIDEVINKISVAPANPGAQAVAADPEPAATDPKTQANAAINNKTEYENYISDLELKPQGAETQNKTVAKTDDKNINQEVETMNLKEIMASDPVVKAEVNALLAESKQAGVIEGKTEIEARIKAAVPYIGNAAYKGMEPLAVKVLNGESGVAALEGAVTAYDMLKEQDNSAAAKKESGKQKETPAESGTGAVDEVASMVAEDSKKIGRV